MPTETRTTDAEARLALPLAFANATVIVEQISDTEVRVRRAPSGNGNGPPFAEESFIPLSSRDRDRFLELLDHPPEPTPALKAAADRRQVLRG